MSESLLRFSTFLVSFFALKTRIRILLFHSRDAHLTSSQHCYRRVGSSCTQRQLRPLTHSREARQASTAAPQKLLITDLLGLPTRQFSRIYSTEFLLADASSPPHPTLIFENKSGNPPPLLLLLYSDAFAQQAQGRRNWFSCTPVTPTGTCVKECEPDAAEDRTRTWIVCQCVCVYVRTRHGNTQR